MTFAAQSSTQRRMRKQWSVDTLDDDDEVAMAYSATQLQGTSEVEEAEDTLGKNTNIRRAESDLDKGHR